MKGIDRKAMKVLLATLDLEQQELADRIGYEKGYVANVLNGLPRHRLGSAVPRRHDRHAPAQSLRGDGQGELSVRAAYEARRGTRGRCAEQTRLLPRPRYRPLAIKNRTSLDGVFVDRICCTLGVHPTSVYGLDYDREASAS